MKTYSKKDILDLYNTPLMALIFEAATVHRLHHDPSKIQVSTLISIKTGGCPEDCGYCPQAARYHTAIEKNELMPVSSVINLAKKAKQNGSSRVCMGAAWRNVKEGEDFEKVLEMVRGISHLNMEVCCTLGMITESQALRLAEAGLHYYNHNLDTSEAYYKEIISTRGYEDRLETLKNVNKCALKVCSGGIIGMGERVEDRIEMLMSLLRLDRVPDSVPINALVPVEGTPLATENTVPVWDIIRMIATTRIVMPKTTVRLSAGRTEMSTEAQALCFMAGASSIFTGEKLLTTPNPGEDKDAEMFSILGLIPTENTKENSDKFKIRKPVLKNDTAVKWTRPGHTIEKNVKATKQAKALRKNQK